MTKSLATPVPAKTIRAAFQSGALDVAKVVDAKGKPVSPASIFGADGTGTKVRGRLHPAFVEAYLAAHPEHTYREKAVSSDERMVTLPLTKANARGAMLKRPESFPISRVRALAGVSGKKGRLSAAEVERATAAVMAERGWDKPAAAKAAKTKA